MKIRGYIYFVISSVALLTHAYGQNRFNMFMCMFALTLSLYLIVKDD